MLAGSYVTCKVVSTSARMSSLMRPLLVIACVCHALMCSTHCWPQKMDISQDRDTSTLHLPHCDSNSTFVPHAIYLPQCNSQQKSKTSHSLQGHYCWKYLSRLWYANFVSITLCSFSFFCLHCLY